MEQIQPNFSSLLLAASMALQTQSQLQTLQALRDHFTYYQLQLLPNQLLPLSPHPLISQLASSLPTLSTRSSYSSQSQQLFQQQQQALTFSQAYNKLQNSNNNQQNFQVKLQTSPINQDQFSIESEDKINNASQMELEENETKAAEKRLISLAQRNIMINFASGLRDFIKFQIQMKKVKSFNFNEVLQFEYQMQQLSKWIQSKQKDFRCFEGWFFFQFYFIVLRRVMLEDEVYGQQLHKLSKAFFGKNFAFTYIKKSRINEQYKEEHYLKIKKFQSALKNYNLFNAHFFKK